jgi:hypothetical protein
MRSQTADWFFPPLTWKFPPLTQKFPPLIFLVNKEIWKTAHEVLESSFMKFLHPWPTAGLWRFWLLPIHEVLMPDTQLEFFMKIFNNLHGVLPSPLCSWGFSSVASWRTFMHWNPMKFLICIDGGSWSWSLFAAFVPYHNFKTSAMKSWGRYCRGSFEGSHVFFTEI